MKQRIDWLVFDLGGVVVEVAPAAATIDRLATLSATDRATLADLLRERFTEHPFSLAERFQIGELGPAGFARALNAQLARPLAFDTIVGALEGMLLGEKAETGVLLERLAAHYRVACFSNTNAVHWQYMQRWFRFFAHIERAFASQEVGYAKPDARAFARVADALAAPAERCLLIDDREVNVEGARAAGWQALGFDDASQLARDLERLGFRTDTPA